MKPSEIIIQNPQGKIPASAPITPHIPTGEGYSTEISGLFGQRVKIRCGDVLVDSEAFDCEFEVPFDDDVEANEATIVFYNLNDTTINQIRQDAQVTIEAGYGDDTGMIFSGVVLYKVTRREPPDKITTVYALDDVSRRDRSIENVSYNAGVRASYILKDLAGKVGLPIAAFSVKRDHTYTDAVTVDGDLMDEIQKYAKVCGVSAYICKQQIYIQSLSEGNSLSFTVSADTGLLDVAPFEEEENHEDYTDTIKGYEIRMLLQHRIQTASVINLQSLNYKGTYRVREGSHEFDGTEMFTKCKAVE